MAIKRLYVYAKQYDAACEAVGAVARSMKVGDPFEPGTQLGPVQNKGQLGIVISMLSDVRPRPEARIVTGGNALDRSGYFVEPTVVAGVAKCSRIVDEEPFGTVLPVIRYTDVDDAIARVNAGPYGRGAPVWGRDLERACEVAGRLHAGMVWVNRHMGADPLAPFGGAKQSGIWRQYGRKGLQGYMEAVTLFLPPRSS